MPRGLILESALWCRYCMGSSDAGKTIEPNDPNWDRLQATARAAATDAAQWLAMEDIYGAVGKDPAVIAAFAGFLTDLCARGTRAVLADYLKG